MVTEFGVLAAIFHEHARNEHALSHRASLGPVIWKLSPGCSEKQFRFRQSFQSARPISGRPWGQMGMGVAEAPAQMLHQGLCSGHVVVKGNRLVQDRPVTGLPQIGGGARNEPERVIVEAAAHVAVALFGQGLVLVVGTAVLKLGGSNVQDALPCAGRDHVDEAQQILTGIPEPHAAADAALVIAGTAAHVEGDHALILVPKAHHPVQLFLAGGQLPAREQLLPVVGQCPAGGIHLCVGGIAGHHGLGPGFVDDAGSAEFFPDRVFNVAQPKMMLFFSPGASVRWKWWAPTGAQPWAMLFEQ